MFYDEMSCCACLYLKSNLVDLYLDFYYCYVDIFSLISIGGSHQHFSPKQYFRISCIIIFSISFIIKTARTI